MTSWLTSAERQELISRLELWREGMRRAARHSPADYRDVIRLGRGSSPWLRDVIQPWQQRDFAALDPAWYALAGRGSTNGIRRAYLERPRGHSKTTDTAIQVTWILQHAKDAVRGLAAAADQEQALLLHTAIADLIRHNPLICPDLEVQKLVVKNRETESRLQVISSDVTSSWGQLPDFVLCDELCHWTHPDLWYSLCSSAAKKPDCLLLVLTNAGIGRGWTWDVREAARTSPEWYFSSLEESCAPWITPQTLAEQRRLLPPPVYARLWQNRWQHSDGEFVTLAEAEACIDPTLTEQETGQPGRQYIAAVDYAEKHDRTVGVVVHREPQGLVVDRMDVAVPAPGQPVLVRWVEDWLVRVAGQFGDVRFILDEYQLLSVIQTYESVYDLTRFDFSAGKGNHALAITLRQLILHRQVRWAPGTGQLASSAGRDDLTTELAALLLKTGSGSRWRIDHRRESGHHDDRAFALGAACLHAIRESPTDLTWDVLGPSPDGSFDWLDAP